MPSNMIGNTITGNLPQRATGSVTGENLAGMNLADESARHRVLASGPVGPWRTLPGSHNVLYNERIRFDADGAGSMQTGSALGGVATQPFRWRCAGHGAIECQPIDPQPEVSAAGELEQSDWFRIAFVIEPQSTDMGKFWVLRETDAEGFWELMAPLVPAN